MRFVDSHCHLDRIDLDKEGLSFEEMMSKAAGNQVDHFLCVAISLDQFPDMVQKAEAFPQVSFSCGVHPCHVGEDKMFSLDDLPKLAANDRVVAIGETGLDYYYSKDSIKEQQEAFARHIEVGNQLDKPIIVHTRDAREDTIAIMKEAGAEQCRGVLHCFTESWEMAKQAMDQNFYISISGIVTFKNAKELQDVVRKMPLDRLLIETDSPYLAPVPYRGKQNQPAYVKHVAEFIADLKGTTVEHVAEQTTQNFQDLFKTAKL